jgi:hypothetical protein
MLSFNQAPLLESRDVLGNRGLRLHAEATRDLSIGRFVTMLGEKACDVIENLFLTLRAG